MTYRVKIEFNQEDFTEKGLDKIRDVICRNQRLDPDRVIMEWPTPILWAKGWMEEYVVEPVEVLGFPVVISEELDIGEDDPPIFGHLEIQVMEEQ